MPLVLPFDDDCYEESDDNDDDDEDDDTDDVGDCDDDHANF